MDLKVVFYVSLDENRKLAIILDNIIKGEKILDMEGNDINDDWQR